MKIILPVLLICASLLFTDARPVDQDDAFDIQDKPTEGGFHETLAQGWNWLKSNVSPALHSIGKAAKHGWNAIKDSHIGRKIHNGWHSVGDHSEPYDGASLNKRNTFKQDVAKKFPDYPDFM